MKIMGFAWLVAGWMVVLASVVLLSGHKARLAFLVAGFLLESLGLGLLVRAHAVEKGGRERDL